jgi:hypothetical protein
MEAIKNNQECCPPFESAAWENKQFEWNDKPFIREKVRTFFFMPINFGGAMRRVMKLIDQTGTSMPDYLCLSDHTSKWNMDIYLAVDKEVPGAENVTLSGKYLSKVYEGNFNKTGEWCKDFETYAKSQGLTVKKWFMWYTTCPKCAKKYGKNYVAIIAEV